jgi:hypothetical protein
MHGFIYFMKTHAIYWKSAVSGQIGTGTKFFEKEEAERLATELNEDYPDINHEAVIPIPAAAAAAVSEPAQVSAHAEQ